MGNEIWSINNDKYLKYEHSTRKINGTYSHIVCSWQLPAISVRSIFSLPRVMRSE